ncbi:hypothetical protein BOTBODRAFT_433415 [Botryobasidium botryosum FD-172 SS1]|uniref:F-box domain-containing protein n=1 Tax=Botryobasidium botryosum (strain FD-172 SS1) TaxID=930990 RepID=A0A067N638_BOTB1|nr:hypothetical protein BOTBODRAFT_433415 [Botryobasidium botryosum FD-172 SS1]
MRSLRTIEIVDAGLLSIAHLLLTLSAPVLEVLRIQWSIAPRDDSDQGPEIGKELAIFLGASNQHLRNVSLEAIRIPQDNLVPVLELLPYVSSLQLSHIYDVGCFLETLASEQLCPQLESIVIADITPGHQNTILSPLRKLVQSDNRPPLQQLAIQECSDFDPSDIAWLSANVADFTFVGS